MKSFTYFGLLFLFTISFNLNCQWTYFPMGKDSNGFLYSVHQIESDNAGNIYCRARAGYEIDIYSPAADTWKRLDIQLPVGMALDKNNKLWIASNGDGLVMYDGTDTVTYNHLLMEYFSDWSSWYKPLAAGITCDDKNNVWFGYGPYLFRMASGELKVFDFEELGIKKLFYEEDIYFYGDKLVFRGTNGYSMIIFDPENPSDYREIQLSDTTEKENKPKIDNIVIYNGDVFCKVTYNWEPTPSKFASIYKFNGVQFDTVAIDYVNEYKSYSIQDFAFDKDGNAVVFVSVWDGTNRYGELVYYKDWEKIAVYRTPEIDDPNQPVKTSFMLANSIHLNGRDVWLCWWALGVMKFSPGPASVVYDNLSEVGSIILHQESKTIEIIGLGPDYKTNIYTIGGELRYSGSSDKTIDISKLSPGIYFVKAGHLFNKIIIY